MSRYINLVYSVALLQVHDPHLAEEITQAVFIILARKAGSLGDKTILPGWLCRTARYASANALTIQRRRQHREQEAYLESILNEAEPMSDETWNQIAPLLDGAMERLGQKDHDALVLRFFEGRSFKEVGAALGAGEDAAKMRVNRALEKLRKFFAKRGVSSTPAILAGVISANSIQAAPVALAKAVTAIAVAKGVAASGSTLTLIKGALKVMAWTKMETIVGIGILIVAGTGAVIVKNNFPPTEPSYQGRRLSEWLVDVDYGQPPQTRAKAAEAIRKMGTKTLPFLLACFSDEKSGDKSIRQATWGFDALGPIAKPAIPKLESCMEKYPGYVPSALAGIGRDALPELLNALTNESFFVRDNTAAAIANAIFLGKISSDEARAAFPIAINNLTYASTNALYQGNTRSRAAWLVAALRLSPDISVPALIQGLDDTNGNGNIAGDCAFALGEFGKDAKPAISALTKAAASTNEQLSFKARQSLNQIEKAR